MFISAETATCSRLVGTETGLDRIAASAELVELIGQFCTADVRPESCFAYSPYVGVGDNSEVREVAGLAVKLSTYTTGRVAWRHIASRPENLLRQFSFMKALNEHLDMSSDVIVPAQYLALRTQHGGFLLVQEYMRDWLPLQQWLDERDAHLERDARKKTIAAVKERLLGAIDRPLLRLGAEDLGLGRREKLHTNNVLIPSATDNVDEAQLCVIDQPSHGLAGKMAVAGLLVARNSYMNVSGAEIGRG